MFLGLLAQTGRVKPQNFREDIDQQQLQYTKSVRFIPGIAASLSDSVTAYIQCGSALAALVLQGQKTQNCLELVES